MLRSLTTSTLAITAMTMPAFAEVTPEQVWQSWVDYYQSVGYTVTEGSRDKAGETLTLSGVVIATTAEGSKAAFNVPQVTLSTQGDGSVKTLFADEMTGTLEGTDADGGTYSMPLTIRVPGNGIVTEGAPEDLTHRFDYPTVEMEVSTVTTDGTEAPFPIRLGMTNTSGQIHMVAGPSAKYDYDMSAESLTFEGDLTDDSEGKVKFAGALEDLQGTGKISTPGGITDLQNEMAAALKAGLVIDGTFKSGAGSASFDYSGIDEEGQPSEGSGKYQGAGLDAGFSLSQAGLGYRVTSGAVNFELASPQMPFPVQYGIESGGFDLQMPVTMSDEPQPFGFKYHIAGVTLADGIWNLFDPQETLPRDPASIELDLSGLMKVVEDVFTIPTPPTEEAMTGEDMADGDMADGDMADGDMTGEGMTDDAMTDEAALDDMPASPFEPVEVNINKVALDLLGAKATATGALKAPGGSIESTVGEIHAEYQGIDALVEKLVAIGLVPQEQAMGITMMMGLFAKPVEGKPDTKATDLEFREGGSIFANGQQIR